MVESTTEAQNLTPTPASQWRGIGQSLAGRDLVLPSGNVARVRRLAPTAFLDQKIMPDPLSEIVHKAIHDKQGLPPEKLKEMAEDPEKIQASLELFDRVLSAVMVMPVVLMPPTCRVCNEYYNVDERHADPKRADYHGYHEGERDPNVLYADSVAVADKMYVFEYAIRGTVDLESFRAQLRDGLGHLSDKSDVPDQTE